MSGCFREAAKFQPLFVIVYLAVIVGTLFSSLYVLSAVYSSSVPLSSFHSNTDLAPYNNNSNTRTAISEQTQKMPPIEAFRLTRELVEKRVKDNIIIVTFGNYAFMEFIVTWAKHLTDLGLKNFLVGAMDTKLLEALYWKGIPVYDMESHMSTLDAGWGSPTFHKMGREKVILIDSILPYGFELLMCDTDMVWLKNPLPYLARYPEADILTSSDQLVPTVIDDRLDIWPDAGGAYNIGIFHWRPTEVSKRLAKAWKDMLLADERIWDQQGFNDLVRKKLGPLVDRDSELFYAFDGTLKLGILPATIFCSGHTYFIQASYQQLRLEPYALHTTFQFGGTQGKRHRMREAMVFYDPPEYYDSPGGFLSFKPSIPRALFDSGSHTVESHFALVNHQIKQIRMALAIASLLNRTLVMPPLWCRLDRFWFVHPGIIEGSMTRQPFLCPLDHVFEVHVMVGKLPDEVYGPNIDIREYSFFDNPSTSKQVKDSWLNVHLCEEGTNDCHASSETIRPGVLRFPKRSTEETFNAVFSPLKDFKVIHFSLIQDAFLGFTDKIREDKFKKRMKRYGSIWCCVANHNPGHIYYDMYWDEKPDWKPIPPQTPQDDHQPL